MPDRAGVAHRAGAPRCFLAFDYGSRRVGVASGNTLLGRAQPLRTLDATGQARFDAIAALLREWQPDALVVGVPRHPDGTPHDNTHRARRFARQLHGRFGLPVHEVDERYSTVEAIAAGAADVDAASAAVILEQFLREVAAPRADVSPDAGFGSGSGRDAGSGAGAEVEVATEGAAEVATATAGRTAR